MLTPRSRTLIVICIGMVVGSAAARADHLDDACRALISDPSWRVRLQAAVLLRKLHDIRSVPSLIQALSDENETVRALAAQVLGELGSSDAVAALERARQDKNAFVREKATEALARVRPPPPPRTLHVEIGGIGNKSGHASPELTRRLREFILRELTRTPGVTLEGKPVSGFLIDSAITELSRKTSGPWIEISCEVSFVVGRLPSHAMVMMTSGGATVQAPRMGFRPERETALEVDALENAVHGAHQNLLAFLKTVQ